MLQGTVPFLPPDYLDQRLEPHQRAILQMVSDNELPPGELATAEVDAALDALELTGVWGRKDGGYAYVRAFMLDEEHMFRHVKVYAMDDPIVPAEVKVRKFIWAIHPDDLFVKVMAKAQTYQSEVLAEDHPEMDAIGFRVVKASEVWLIKRDRVIVVKQQNNCIHPDALSMLDTGGKRRVLARALENGDLTNVLTMEPTMLSKGRGVVKELRNAKESMLIDKKAQLIAKAFMARAGRKKK